MENNKKVKYDGKPFEHEFDGIKELNNAIPPWLLYFWYITVTFSVIYVAYYHFIGKEVLQDDEYQQEMTRAEQKLKNTKPVDASFSVVLLSSEEDMASGEKIFKEKLCVTCHGVAGEGNTIGPNLTDKYWIHGKGQITDVYDVITNGVIQKGMVPYKGQLTENQILQVSSFILAKLQGTNPPNSKEPQGVLVE
jgi:cytochrome c oxidase cbb3-type subunit 3